jgi:hypothetical protein
LGWAIFEPELRSFKMPAGLGQHEAVEEVAMGLKIKIFEPKCSNIVFGIDRGSVSDMSNIKLNPLPLREVILHHQNRSPKGTFEDIVRHELAIRDQGTWETRPQACGARLCWRDTAGSALHKWAIREG